MKQRGAGENRRASGGSHAQAVGEPARSDAAPATCRSRSACVRFIVSLLPEQRVRQAADREVEQDQY